MTDLKDHIVTAVEIAEAAGTAVTMYPNQVRYLLDNIASYERQLNDLEAENALLKAGAEKLDEMVEQFLAGSASYELGHAIDEKPVGDIHRMGYAWAAYYDLSVSANMAQASVSVAAKYKAENAALRARVAELEAELERMTNLIRGGVEVKAESTTIGDGCVVYPFDGEGTA